MAGWRQRLGAWIAGERKMNSLELFKEIYGSRASRSGATVTPFTAAEVPTVLACWRVIANGVAQVPWRPYQDVGRTKRVADNHDLYPLLHRRPNPWQTSYEFRETVMFHVLATGNAYIFVNRVGIARKIVEMIPIEPGRVSVKQLPDYRLEYRVRGNDGQEQVFGSDAIWHFRGPSWNTWLGLEAVKLAREAIGLAISLEQGQAEFQKGGAATSGVLATKEKLSPERYALLAAWLDKHMPGGERFGKPLLVDDGAAYTATSMTAVDQQLIETRKHQIEEICRAFGVMPIMVGHADKTATYASAEQMFLAHVVHTLSPWYQRFEQSADVNLLSEEDRKAGFYTKFNPNALMRGAAKDQAAYFKAALGTTQQPGWMTPNEVRGLIEMDPIDGGDELTPLITDAAPPAAQPDDDEKEEADAA
jgi:HK97 family phage portal protein